MSVSFIIRLDLFFSGWEGFTGNDGVPNVGGAGFFLGRPRAFRGVDFSDCFGTLGVDLLVLGVDAGGFETV